MPFFINQPEMIFVKGLEEKHGKENWKTNLPIW